MLSTRRLQQRLVGSSTTCNNADHATNSALDNLLCARGELDAGLALVGVVANDGNVVSTRSAKGTSVTNLLLHVADNGTFRDGSEREDVSDGESSVLSSVDELTGVHALVGDEGLGVEFVSVWVTENDPGEWCTTSCIVNDLLHHSADVTVSLGIVVCSKLGRGLVETSVGSVDGSTTLPLIANNTTLVPSVSSIPF